MNRREGLEQLNQGEFDLCIIGAGASGAGAALDAALRGLRVLLIDADDFSSGTSSRSTKLIHGGVRYLEQAFKNFDFAQLKQVRHGLEERHSVLTNAPHLSSALPLVTPVFSWIEGLYFTIGLKIYSFFASKNDVLPSSAWLSKKTVMQRVPGLSPKLHSAVLYYDGQLDDARYALALSQSAHEAGAVTLNHLRAEGFEMDEQGQLTAIHLGDQLTGQKHMAKAKAFLNCTGPYADHIRIMANPAKEARIRPSKGVHAILPLSVLGSQQQEALLIPKTPDGRVVFAIPFQNHLLLGTTDEDFQGGDTEPILNRKEVEYLLETLQPYVSQKVTPDQVTAGFGGLRPLIAATGKQTKGLVRDHEVEFDEHSKLFSLLGGKWTTYRLMAQDAVDDVCQFLGNTKPCTTQHHVLAGGEGYQKDHWHTLQAATKWPESTCRHLAQSYGTRAQLVCQIAQEQPEWSNLLFASFPIIEAEVVYVARHEMCCTVRDFMARRTRLEILDWKAAHAVTERVSELLGFTLGWSETQIRTATTEYRQLLKTFEIS